jgi:O-antigen/teichoic acid export membrane protein
LIYAFAKLGIGTAPWKASRTSIRDALSFGLPLVFAVMTIWVANNGIRFVVEHYQDATAVGLLTVGWGLGLRAATFAAMLTTAAAFPVAMKRARLEGMDAGQSQLERNGVLLLAALAPASAGLWAISVPLVQLTISEPFHATTIAVLPLAILAGAIRSFRIHFGEQIFLLHERTLIPLWNDIFDAVASTLGSLLGLWSFGLYGAVAGATLGALASLIVTLTFARYAYCFGVALLDCIKIIAVAGFMGLAVRAMGVPANAPGLLVAIAGGAILYAGGIAAFYPDAVSKVMDVARDLIRKPDTG